MADSEEEIELKKKLIIDELRYKFSRLESLNNTLESKASGLFGFTAILITVIIFTIDSILSNSPTTPLISALVILTIISIFIILCGLIFLLDVIKLRLYSYPFTSDPNIISRKLKKPYKDVQEKVIEDYRESIPHHSCINAKKVESLKNAMICLKIGVFASIVLLILIIIIKIIGGF